MAAILSRGDELKLEPQFPGTRVLITFSELRTHILFFCSSMRPEKNNIMRKLLSKWLRIRS